MLLIRHLEPEESVRGRAYGSLDVPLSAAARRHADELAQGLEGVRLAAVYTSPLRRAYETAAPIAARHGLVPCGHAGLRELDFGELESRRYEDVERTWPELFLAWMDDPTGVSFPGGESFADLRGRAIGAADEIRARHAGSAVAVVAHGGVTRAILAAVLDMPDDAIFRLDQAYGGVSVIDWFGDTAIVRLLNAKPSQASGHRASFGR
jgi:broad specificity phosphatase PhoE